jgi:UDP-N-acetylmuramate--alanine ligase
VGLVEPVDPVPLSELSNVHLIGIGGAGMSGIARVLIAGGAAVSGSDKVPSAQLDELSALGAVVHVGHQAAHLGSATTVVVTSAIRADNPELVEARRRGLRVLHRATALASLMQGKRGVAVAGTHGKTTTTAMITTVLAHCGADPSYVIGGVMSGTGLGSALGSGELFVAEADESDGSFRMLTPEVAVVTSIEADHLDNYASLAEIEKSFAGFVVRIVPGGLLVTCADDPGASRLASGPAGSRLRRVSYGSAGGAGYRLSEYQPRGLASRVNITGPTLPRQGVTVELAVPGRHNGLNAAAALAVAVELGFPVLDAAAGLESYRGARRRMELTGEADGVTLLDSYAHHPTELAADLTAARDIVAGGRVIAVFQPHLYSRTRLFADGFGAVLGEADEAIVLDVYAAREDPEPGVSGELIASAVPGGRAVYLPDRSAVPDAVAGVAKPGDLVLTMGAGDVNALGPDILDALRRRSGQR